jgi:hypothetical protein
MLEIITTNKTDIFLLVVQNPFPDFPHGERSFLSWPGIKPHKGRLIIISVAPWEKNKSLPGSNTESGKFIENGVEN